MGFVHVPSPGRVGSGIALEIVAKLGVKNDADAPTVGGGMTGFMGPDGKWLAEPHRGDDAIVYGDLDLGVIAFPKFFADSAGHYARPDVFTFGVNGAAQQVLTSQSVGPVDFGLSDGAAGGAQVLAPLP